jgi:hypothetical protein
LPVFFCAAGHLSAQNTPTIGKVRRIAMRSNDDLTTDERRAYAALARAAARLREAQKRAERERADRERRRREVAPCR